MKFSHTLGGAGEWDTYAKECKEREVDNLQGKRRDVREWEG